MSTARLGLYPVLWVAACTSEPLSVGDPSCESGEARCQTPELVAVLPQDAACAGADRNDCSESPKITPVDWSVSTQLGAPVERFGAREGHCTADFSGGAPEVPATQTEITVSVALDHGSARWVQPQPRRASICCRPYLEVDGRVDLETTDGRVQVFGAATTLQWRGAATPILFEFGEPLRAQQGTLSIPRRPGETGTFRYVLDGAGPACAGEIWLSRTRAMGNQTLTSADRVADWSNTGCPLGSEPFDVAKPASSDRLTLPMLIERVWGNGTYKGRWEDGGAAELALEVVASNAEVCRELEPGAAVHAPVVATYGTSDGRIRSHTSTAASVHASLSGGATRLELWLDDVMRCADEDTQLDYTPADCARVQSAAVQFGMDYSGAGEPDLRELSVYLEERNSPERLVGDRLLFGDPER